ncbi:MULTISPECIES: alpha/beta hydrolase [unclassified Sphingobium]|uniref:alpha/beta hydrolase n=1 Tax=unclassified Sphingobium TaxID=2611147 RepID=UPI0022245216|nr:MULTISPECIES: alpha/beta hydrolase [unclassified Sphingobium]MCW2382975.1 acetyl esterase/lipase [Sphingobium sp. B2D3B]MCW2400049.1 acetyl esterase/lipase [Sphingobium sp. B2D3C]
MKFLNRSSAWLVAALLATTGPAHMASAQPLPDPAAVAAAPLSAEDAAKLAPVAPELHGAARMALYYSTLMGQMTEDSVRASRKSGNMGPPPPPHHRDVPVVEQMIPGAAGAPQVKLYVINAQQGAWRGGILHTHGGGYILGTAATDVRRLQEMAKELNVVIVSVEYRLAPETTYAGSIEDNYAGLRWMHDNAAKLGLDPKRIAVMGESAGGGHAALLALTARDRGEIPVAFQVLIYPMLDDRTGGVVKVPSHIATVGWDAQQNQLGWKAFLGQQPGTNKVPATAVPARAASLKGLPPAFIAVGGVDLFVSEDIDYARRLTEAGVPTELLVVPSAYHGFDAMAPDSPQAKQFNKARIEALRRALATPEK